MPPSKAKATGKPRTAPDLAKPSPASKVTEGSAKSSGVSVIAVRVADFRSLTSIEISLDKLTVLVGANNAGKTSLLDTVQFAIGANRRLLGKEDIRLAKNEAECTEGSEKLWALL